MRLFVMALICSYLAYNFAVAETFTTREMHKRLISGQNFVGLILTNIFYAPAWFLKVIQYRFGRF